MALQRQSLKVPLRVREEGREERSAAVLISVSIEPDAQTPSRRQLMCFQLTDETDSFFLYNLKISEEEFQVVKADQGILVDFTEFPAKFLEQLRCCLGPEGSEAPKFNASLVSTPSSTYLQIVETNQFKNVTHLKLDMRPGNDAAVKRYLAGELAKTKEERDSLRTKLLDTEAQLLQESEACKASVADARNKADGAVRELNEVKVSHAQVCAELREQAAQLQQELNAQSEAERSDLQKSHRAKETQLQSQVEELRVKLETLGLEKSTLQNENRELASKLKIVDTELGATRQELATQREENKNTDKTCHQQAKELQAREVRLSTLEQQVADGKAMAEQLNQLVESAHAQKGSLEESVRLLKDNNGKLEDKVKCSSADLSKANQMLERLQNELKTIKTKLKVKAAVVLQQEKVVQDKEQELADAGRSAAQLQQTISEKEGLIDILNGKLQQAEARVEAAQETLGSNEKIIHWLNQELNSAQMSTRGAFSASAFRPSIPATGFSAGLSATGKINVSSPEVDFATSQRQRSLQGGSGSLAPDTLTSSRSDNTYKRGAPSPSLPTGHKPFSRLLSPNSVNPGILSPESLALEYRRKAADPKPEIRNSRT